MTVLRFGLVGTGHWARVAHAPALASTEGVGLTSVWGRDREAAGRLAGDFGATAAADLDEFLTGVDAVAFAVPPDVQAPIAVRAAQAGRHLLLEKPTGLTEAAASEVAEAVARAGVASVVFFTARFRPEVRAWLAEVAAAGPWLGAHATYLGEALAPGNPFDTPWRRQRGGVWDLGPHVLSMLWASLGPVTGVIAEGGPADVTHLILRHASGASSTATMTLSAPAAATGAGLELWGEPGRWQAPGLEGEAVPALRIALAELAAGARAGETSHPCDAGFGRDITAVLAAAQAQLDARRG